MPDSLHSQSWLLLQPCTRTRPWGFAEEVVYYISDLSHVRAEQRTNKAFQGRGPEREVMLMHALPLPFPLGLLHCELIESGAEDQPTFQYTIKIPGDTHAPRSNEQAVVCCYSFIY